MAPQARVERDKIPSWIEGTTGNFEMKRFELTKIKT